MGDLAAARAVYRNILREVRKSPRDDAQRVRALRDLEHAVLFMRSTRIHKELLDRYNPLHDLTPSERNKATARRVGLDMPVEHKPGES